MKFRTIFLVSMLIAGGCIGYIWCYGYAQNAAAELAEKSIQESRSNAAKKLAKEQEREKLAKIAEQKRLAKLKARMKSAKSLFSEIADTYGHYPTTLEWGCKTPSGMCIPVATARPMLHLAVENSAWNNVDQDAKSLLIDYARYNSLDGVMLVSAQGDRVLIEKQAWKR